MYIKSLSLYETHPEKKLINNVSFKKGMNFIVDAGNNQEKGNSVGKTTILKLIDIGLGAKDKKYIYTDFDMDSDNIPLKNYIHDSKIQVQLNITSDLEVENLPVTNLSVDLFERGKRSINGEKMAYEAYKEKLNEIFFNNSINKPSFRQLIGMFVRIDQKYDNNKFLKYLDRNTTTAQYEHIYSFLFELQNQDISTKILNIKNDIRAKEDDIKNHKKINGFKSIDVINQKVSVIETDLHRANEKLSLLIDSKKFKENEEKINQIKLTYGQLNDAIDKYTFRTQRIENILSDAQKEATFSIDTSILSNLYSDTKENFSNLDTTFEELIAFNNQLLNNKINYFSAKLSKVSLDLEKAMQQREDLFNQHRNIIMLIEDDKIDEYSKLQETIASLNEAIGKNKQILEVYNSLEKQLKKFKEALEKLESKSSDTLDSIELFNSYFSNYSKKTNNEEFILYHTEEGFPLAIDNIGNGLSTGTKKSIIAAFDLAYQSFSNDINKPTPKFIIHDVIESVDKVALNAIISIVNQMDCQFIVAVLNEKIENNKQVAKNDIRLVLSENNRPFKI